MTSFSSQIFHENFYLLVRAPDPNNGFAHRVSLIFNPFSTALWGMVLVATMFTGKRRSALDSYYNLSYPW